MTTTVDGGWRIQTSTTGTGCAIEVAGVLSWHSAPELRAAMSRAESSGADSSSTGSSGTRSPGRLLLDLSGVVQIDSAGTGALIASAVRAHREETGMAVLTSGAVAEVVDAVGIADYVTVFSDRDSAYRWVAGGTPGSPSSRRPPCS